MNRFAYVARLACGCPCGFIIYDPDDNWQTRTRAAEYVAQWIVGGLPVDRVPESEYRKMTLGCKCGKAAEDVKR